jgi:hypothetical protein
VDDNPQFTPTALLPRTFLVGALACLLFGCSLPRYRLSADREAYQVVAEKATSPRWAQPGFSIAIDPRSRYYDQYDPDREPMPPDDPAAHQYMHYVDGMKGWKHWDDNGSVSQLENPDWRTMLVRSVGVIMSVNSALARCQVWRVGSSGSEADSTLDKGGTSAGFP